MCLARNEVEESVGAVAFGNHAGRSGNCAGAAGALASDSAAYPLYGDGERTLVVKYPYGRGEVLWWASATPLTNAGLKEQGNLEFVACVRGAHRLARPTSAILWDEYIHGYRQTLGSSIAHSPVKWLVLQLVLLALGCCLPRFRGGVDRSASRFRSCACRRLNLCRRSADCMRHAGTASVAVDICYQRFRYWLTRRLGVASNISVNDLELRCGIAGRSSTITLSRFCGAASRPRTILICMGRRRCSWCRNSMSMRFD